MNYISLSFALFVFITASVYYLVPIAARRWVLLFLSLFFYLSFGVSCVFFLLCVAVSTYWAAKTMDQKRRKWILSICLAFNICVWLSIKILPSLGEKAGLWEINSESVIAPIGISYYLLQAFSYLVDVYRGVIRAEHSFSKYLLFLSYFPAAVQGPISRYSQLETQLEHSKPFDSSACTQSIFLIFYGLIKKMVVADRLGLFVNYCFDSGVQLQGFVLYLGAIAYAFQLYMDFSGCVDICRGVSGIFGIELVQNFNTPYLSKSIREFWSRWHISLSRWLRDYVYIPLGGNRKGIIRKNLNLMITFGVSGIWHGAHPNYLVWGFLQAIYQIAGEYTDPFRHAIKKKIGIGPDSFSDKFYRTCLTFHLTLISWIFFRAGSVSSAVTYLRNMITAFDPWTIFNTGIYGPVSFQVLTVVFLHICVLMYLEFQHITPDRLIRGICSLHGILRFGVYLLVIFDLLIFGVYGSGYNVSGFMYGGF